LIELRNLGERRLRLRPAQREIPVSKRSTPRSSDCLSSRRRNEATPEQRFARAVADGLVPVSVQNQLRLDAYNELEPDFVALRPRLDAYAASHRGAADALIVVEVSDSSLDHDRKTKLPLYAGFGVEVWIVDLSGSAVEVYRDPTEDRCASSSRMTQGALTPARIPTIDLATFLA
jgi:hypothetical protein